MSTKFYIATVVGTLFISALELIDPHRAISFLLFLQLFLIPTTLS